MQQETQLTWKEEKIRQFWWVRKLITGPGLSPAIKHGLDQRHGCDLHTLVTNIAREHRRQQKIRKIAWALIIMSVILILALSLFEELSTAKLKTPLILSLVATGYLSIITAFLLFNKSLKLDITRWERTSIMNALATDLHIIEKVCNITPLSVWPQHEGRLRNRVREYLTDLALRAQDEENRLVATCREYADTREVSIEKILESVSRKNEARNEFSRVWELFKDLGLAEPVWDPYWKS